MTGYVSAMEQIDTDPLPAPRQPASAADLPPFQQQPGSRVGVSGARQPGSGVGVSGARQPGSGVGPPASPPPGPVAVPGTRRSEVSRLHPFFAGARRPGARPVPSPGSEPPPIDITPGEAPPPADSAAIRRRRTVLLAAAALAAMVAGGAAYAAAGGPAERPRAAVLPSVSLPARPFEAGPVPPPAADPVTPSPSATAAPASTASAPATAAVPGRRVPRPTGTTGAAGAPPPARDPRPTPTTPRLTARMSGGGQWIADGLIGYGGTVRLDNSGRRVAAGWRVTMTVPGGNPMDADGPVTVTRDGDRVTFAPGGPGAGVRPGDSFTFGFRIGGVLPAPPYGCAVNGHACS